MSAPLLFLSSGDPIADRRYDIARDFLARGDVAAAADLLEQAIEQAPDFASAWFALGELRAAGGDRAAAVAAFQKADTLDAADRLGARLHLARLGAADPATAMSPDYVRTLFDQYAPRFDKALVEGLRYRGPDVLLAAVLAACEGLGRKAHFDRALDLGCGTGLAGRAFWQYVDCFIGIDISPGMIEGARQFGCYGHLHVADIAGFLRDETAGCTDLIIAADALVYLADLARVFREAARALEPDGLFAFTVETHAGDGIVLGEKFRYAHGEAYIRKALAQAGLTPVSLAAASTRQEAGAPVPGLVVVAQPVDRSGIAR